MSERSRRPVSASTFSARRVFVSCGEPSGETHAVDFVRCMRGLSPETTFLGFGGHTLEEAGVTVRQNLVDHAVMGFRAVLGQVPFFARVVARFVQILTEERPDVVVLVDYPGLHLILAEEARRMGVPVLYYVCPQYWAWAPWRMRRFRRAVDGAIAILPFEPPLFERHGIPTAFAGNPLLAHLPELAPEPREELLAILPGSRRSELVRHLGPVIDIWRRFHARHPSARAILPQQGERRAARVRQALDTIEANSGAIPALEIADTGAFDVLAGARAALVKSGTSTLQTALCRTPQVVFYKTSGRSEMLFAKGFLSTAWIAAPNLVLGRDAIPERYFADARAWSAIETDLEAIWSEGPSRRSQLAACDEVRERVQGDGAGREVARWLVDDDRANDDRANDDRANDDRANGTLT
ncbi:MAG: hypothetical protein H6833_06810 [Planctomycetes bacterium]|nr:hypothetical protein [Planctomycetota bacterium]